MSSVSDDVKRRSEEARQAAMWRKIEENKQRQQKIAADIAAVDAAKKKRIVFADDSDDEKPKKSTGKANLFGDSGDEEEEIQLNIANRHTGEKGEKLMKLESRFNSDPRFKLDDKFVESDSDDEQVDESVIEMREEKKKNKELLSKILGKAVGEEKKKPAVMARPFTRFDPENPEHVEWMKSYGEATSGKKNKKKDKKKKEEEEVVEEEEDAEEEKAPADKEEEEESDDDDVNREKIETFYQMDKSFADQMKQGGNNGGFSFLSMMGRSEKSQRDDEPAEDITNSATSSSIEDEVEEVTQEDVATDAQEFVDKKRRKKMGIEAEEAPIPTSLTPRVKSKFFLTEKDPRVMSMATNFRRTQDIQKVINNWTTYRDAIFKIWQKQRKLVMTKQKNEMNFAPAETRKRRMVA